MSDETISINGITLNKVKILSLVYNNKTISAIKYVRDKTHLSLKVSKDIVDNLKGDPYFYDSNDNEINDISNIDFETSSNYNLETPKRGQHFIEYNSSKTKNYIIILLAALIFILAFIIFSLQNKVNV